MRFIPPMLATRLEDPRRLADPRFIAEPKLDGQRAQVHIERGGAVACYSCPGRELLGLPGRRSLTAIRWPVRAALPLALAVLAGLASRPATPAADPTTCSRPG